jgi:tRNA(Ile)-lysidine synthase TilS/MesJ
MMRWKPFYLNLICGTGIAVVSLMESQKERNETSIRPSLLALNSANIEEMLEENNTLTEDSSNASNKYAVKKIKNQLILFPK